MYYAITGALIITLSSLLSLFLVKHYASQHPKEVKVVLFGLYFWGLAFLQLIICAVAYALLER